MWDNSATFHSVYMLPNAARLYTDAQNRLDYVTTVLAGDVLGDGYTYEIEVITALNADAFANPVIPIGNTGSLNFLTGVLTIPSYTDFELYLHEISAAWLVEQMQSGFIRTLMGDQNEINECARVGSDEVPEGVIIEGLIDGGVKQGIKMYWIGDTPDTVSDPNQTLILLMVNEKTDEVAAYRTTVNMLEKNAPLVPVSMYLFRDARSDRMEQEKYNVFWFDSFTDNLSLAKVVTNVLAERTMEMPRTIRIPLRAYFLAGADTPVYSLGDHLFVMCNGADGSVSLFGSSYNATFDGDVFEDDYIRIEGISTGNLILTIKQGQYVWPGKIDEQNAEALNGKKFQLKDGKWVELTEETESIPSTEA